MSSSSLDSPNSLTRLSSKSTMSQGQLFKTIPRLLSSKILEVLLNFDRISLKNYTNLSFMVVFLTIPFYSWILTALSSLVLLRQFLKNHLLLVACRNQVRRNRISKHTQFYKNLSATKLDFNHNTSEPLDAINLIRSLGRLSAERNYMIRHTREAIDEFSTLLSQTHDLPDLNSPGAATRYWNQPNSPSAPLKSLLRSVRGLFLKNTTY